jgi:hypothetical protein
VITARAARTTGATSARVVQIDQIVHGHDVAARHESRHEEGREMRHSRPRARDRERQTDLLREIEVVALTDRDEVDVGRHAGQPFAQLTRVVEHARRHVRGLARIERDPHHRAAFSARNCTASG